MGVQWPAKVEGVPPARGWRLGQVDSLVETCKAIKLSEKYIFLHGSIVDDHVLSLLGTTTTGLGDQDDPSHEIVVWSRFFRTIETHPAMDYVYPGLLKYSGWIISDTTIPPSPRMTGIVISNQTTRFSQPTNLGEGVWGLDRIR